MLAFVAGACSSEKATPAPTPSPQLATWTQLTDAPAARAGAATAVADGLLYLAGGVGPEGVLRRVDHYDAAVNAWTAAPDLPIALRDAVAVGRGAEVIVLGGFTDAAGTVPSGRVFALKGDAWTELPPMRARGGLGAALVKDKIYAVGGVEARGRVSDRVEVLSDGRWTTAAPMPTGRANMGVTSGPRYITTVGGRVGERVRREVERFDTATGAWQRRAQLPSPRADLTAIGSGSTILAIGGTAASPEGALASIETYAVGGNVWTTFEPALPVPLRAMGAAVLDTRIVVATGSTTGGAAYTAQTYSLAVTLTQLVP